MSRSLRGGIFSWMLRPGIFCAGVILAALAILSANVAMAQTTIRVRLLPISNRTPAPAFTLRDAAGKPVSLSGLRGKVVVLDFWATWCGGCKEELPWFSQLDTKYAGGGVAVVGASVDDGGWALVKKYLSAHPVRYSMMVADTAM